MRRLLTLLACAWFLSAPALAQVGPDIERAESLFTARKYSDALRVVDTAFRKQGLPRLSVIKLYELQGICAAQLNQDVKAKTAFQNMLQLDPKRELPKFALQAPVTAAFRKAKDWADGRSALDFMAAAPLTDEQGRVVQIAAKVKNDAMKLSRKVRFHVKADGNVWTELDMEVAASFSAAATDATVVEWWAELMGDREAVLASLGSERNPIRNSAKAVAAPEEEKNSVLSVTEQPKEPEDPVKPEEHFSAPVPVVDLRPPPRSGSVLKPVAYGLWGGAAGALGVGLYFGYQSNAARSKVTGAIAKAGGQPVTDITQEEAYRLEKQSQGDALKANILFGTAAGLAVAGGICFWLGLDGDDNVAIAPMPNGAAVVGRW